MAAEPLACVVSAALPASMTDAEAEALMDGLNSAADEADCPLIGGDVTIWDQRLLLGVTLLGRPWPGAEVVGRGGAKAGDALVVSGELGGSLAGEGDSAGHMRFRPRVEAARAIRARWPSELHAMIDLSDGLGKDAARLAVASGLDVTADVAAIPISREAKAAAEVSGRAPWEHAAGDGEDYELCLAVASEAADWGPAGLAIADVSLRVIGRFEAPAEGAEPRLRFRLPDGSERSGAELGWEHRS
jgi:thiamine-monophosphate kinase